MIKLFTKLYKCNYENKFKRLLILVWKKLLFECLEEVFEI
jgi:hypothetical protein